jgi:aspartate kinase
LSFSVCIDQNSRRFKQLTEILYNSFNIKYNESLQLVTIRHFTKQLLDELSADKRIFMEQLSRNTAQLVLQ